MGFNSAFKELKLLKKPGNVRLNNLNDPVHNVLIRTKLPTEVTFLSSTDMYELLQGCGSGLGIVITKRST
jgi:hypothetical protein